MLVGAPHKGKMYLIRGGISKKILDLHGVVPYVLPYSSSLFRRHEFNTPEKSSCKGINTLKDIGSERIVRKCISPEFAESFLPELLLPSRNSVIGVSYDDKSGIPVAELSLDRGEIIGAARLSMEEGVVTSGCTLRSPDDLLIALGVRELDGLTYLSVLTLNGMRELYRIDLGKYVIAITPSSDNNAIYVRSVSQILCE